MFVGNVAGLGTADSRRQGRIFGGLTPHGRPFRREESTASCEHIRQINVKCVLESVTQCPVSRFCVRRETIGIEFEGTVPTFSHDKRNRSSRNAHRVSYVTK